MSYTHFQSDILPSPFVASDQLINTLVYGSFFEESSTSLRFFLLPISYWWSSLSYLLGSLYSYLLFADSYKTVVYIWHDDVDKPQIPSDEGIDFVLGKQITYDMSVYQSMNFESLSCPDFAMSNPTWSQHAYYLTISSMKASPIILPRDWWINEANREELKNFLSILQENQIACVFIDTFDLQEIQDQESIEMTTSPWSLSDLYNQYALIFWRKEHLLALQPMIDGERWSTVQWVFGF